MTEAAKPFSLIKKDFDCVADTMAVVLHLENRRKPAAAKAWFTAAEKAERRVGISTITLAEIGYLGQKGRIGLTPADVVAYAYRYSTIVLASLTPEVVMAAFAISDIPELHDRLIAGTAHAEFLLHKTPFPVLTNDPVITASAFVETVWDK